MKKVKIVLFILIFCLGSLFIPKTSNAQGASVSFQVFYDDLSPYGTWVETPNYGYVWVPNVAAGFQPYGTDGYWVYTDAGWTWVSNYPWGWAPFHYGRWYNDPSYGEMWVPGDQWGPGWVTWRMSGGYYGWAPIGPGGNSYRVTDDRWRFVKDGDFGRENISHYYVNTSNNANIVRSSLEINNKRLDKSNNKSYNSGPSMAAVEKYTGKKITPVRISESSKPGEKLSSNQLQMYRPQVSKSSSGGKKAAPSKVANVKDLKKQPAESRKQSTAESKKTTTQHAVQPKSKPVEKHTAQPSRQAPKEQQRKAQPARQAPKEQQHAQPARQAPKEQQHAEPARQEPKQQHAEPARQEQPKEEEHSTEPRK